MKVPGNKPFKPIQSVEIGDASNEGSRVAVLSGKLEDYRDLQYFHKSWLMPNIETTKVGQGHSVASKNQLSTAGLGSCCAMGFRHGGINFLTHADAGTNPESIKSEILGNFDVAMMRADEDLKICFWQGCMGSTNHATNVIGQALDNLGLLNKLVFVGNVESHMKTVGVNEKGTFEHMPEKFHGLESSGGAKGVFGARILLL